MSAKQKTKSGEGHVHGPDCGHNHQHGHARVAAATTAPATPLLIDEASFTPMPGVDSNDRSKDELFVRLAFVADAMIKAHGKDFTMGSLVLAARFIAEGKPLIKRKPETEAAGS